jgi:hypothetical protein
MISQYELHSFLHQKLPELSENWGSEQMKSPYKTMQALLNATTAKVREHQFREVKKCLETVDFLYEKGNGIIKNAVENIYVYSLSHVLYAAQEDRGKVLSIIPITLYTLYVNQLKRSGC